MPSKKERMQAKGDELGARDGEGMLKATRIAERLTGLEKRSLQEALLSGGTRILETIPLEDAGFALPRQTFRDAVALLMGQPLPDGLPDACPHTQREWNEGS